MRRNVLYEHAVTLPRALGHFYRPRIDRQLSGLLDCHLIAVSAGAGWGKTHAITTFLNRIPARVMWFQLTELDNHPARFWEEFVYILSLQNKDTAARLGRMEFPETLAQFDQFLHIFAREIYSREQAILVLDDFHLLQDKSINHFVENLVHAKLENFCVIINSRTKLSMNISGMVAGGLAGELTSEDLRFTLDETEGYLRQQGVILSERELKKVSEFTGGWPLALYLVSLSIKKGGVISNDPIAGAMPMIFEMIQREMFSDYTPVAQRFLIKASLLAFFPQGLIAVLSDGQPEAVFKILETNTLIHYNPYTKHYSFHHLFLEFLTEKQELLSPRETADTYRKAAAWCAANNLKTDALAYYDKCGDYDEIINITVNHGAATFSRSVAEFYIGLIDRIPKKLIAENPIMHVLRAGLLLNHAEFQPAIAELLETRRELESQPLTEKSKKVLGEIYCMLGLLNLGSSNYDFVELFKKASEFMNSAILIDSTGKSINTKYAIILSGTAPGELEKMEAALFSAIPYVSGVMGGYAWGLDYLASAEAAYFTGDMKKASMNAYEAIYRAQEKQVSDVASSGYFLLMRVEAFNGNYSGVVSNLDKLRSYVSGLEDPWNFNGMQDVAEGWFQIVVGHPERVAGWIVDDSLGSGVLAPFSIGMERSIKARCLLALGRYFELLAWLGRTEERLRESNMLLILLDTLICKAAAFHQIGDVPQAASALREAYEIAHGNNLVMQFVEMGGSMRALIQAVKREKPEEIPAAWLDEIATKSATHEKRLNSLRTQHEQVSGPASKPAIKFTKREKEMLGYLCQGLTNMEIADSRYISLSAVKKMLNNIYIKLGAANRADAVRIAMQLELNL